MSTKQALGGVEKEKDLDRGEEREVGEATLTLTLTGTSGTSPSEPSEAEDPRQEITKLS